MSYCHGIVQECVTQKNDHTHHSPRVLHTRSYISIVDSVITYALLFYLFLLSSITYEIYTYRFQKPYRQIIQSRLSIHILENAYYLFHF